MKLLLAVDGSECSERAARFLTRFDFSPRDEIIILHSISEIPYDDDSYANIRRHMKRVAPHILQSAANILGPVRANIVRQEVEGYPDSTIIEEAENAHAELIVMGTRGITGIKSMFIGSSTRAVAINSRIPVLVTRLPQWKPSEKMRVLLATEGSPSAVAAADLLTSMPLRDDTEIMITTVVKKALSDIPKQFAAEINETIKDDVAKIENNEYEHARKITGQAAACLNKRFARTEEKIGAGDPSMEILKAAEQYRADIVAVGGRGLKGMKGMMGSVSRRVLGHAQCPVLIGKAAQPAADEQMS